MFDAGKNEWNDFLMQDDAPEHSSKKPVIGIACGGTGGHIFPGMATGSVLKSRGYNVVLWLAGKDIEKIAIKEWDGKAYRLEIVPLFGKNLFKVLFALYKMCKAFFLSLKTLRKENVKILLAMGSYASVPVALAAKTLGIKLVLHEANAVPGKAVHFLAKFAEKVALTFEEAKAYFPDSVETVLTGMPIRKIDNTFKDGPARKNEQFFTLLVFGGSRGAASLNRIVPEAIALLQDELSLKVIHITGIEGEQLVRESYTNLANKVAFDVISFTHNIGMLYLQTDLAICRAGASTCAELLEYGVPAILIPYPYATNQHQLVNAQIMERKGVALCLEEKDCSAQKLAALIKELLNSKEKLIKMRQLALKAGVGDAAKRLAALVEKALSEELR